MARKSIVIYFLLLSVLFFGCDSAWAKLTIQSKEPVQVELTGFNGLDEFSIFKGEIAADNKRRIETPYRGLALLVFAGGQSYPVILGAGSFTLTIVEPGKPPAFTGSAANDYFYRRLSGSEPARRKDGFADLMLQAKDLLQSSYAIKTVAQLSAGKKKFQEFVGKHYDRLQHSDMVRRLLAQYFMMHEYVDYHIKDAPAADIRVRYQKEVLNGVNSWLRVLSPNLPKDEILNYCVSLYYRRSMVTLAGMIIDNFKEFAYCPGDARDSFGFAGNIKITGPAGGAGKKLADFRGGKTIAFVSDDCPVSMVAAVIKARRLADRKSAEPLIVAPLEKLSGSHLAMAGMVRSGNMFFVDDEKWRKENLPARMKLPFFVTIPAESAGPGH